MIVEISKLIGVTADCDMTVKRKAFVPEEWDMANLMECVKAVGVQMDPRFVIDKDNRFCYENLVKWLVADPSMQAINPDTKKRVAGRVKQGLYIYGPTGTGKTTATRVLSRLAYAFNMPIMYRGTQRKFAWKSYRCDELAEKAMRGDSLNEVRTEPIICFQDLGTEPDEVVYMGNRIPLMRNVLSQRGEWENITIITSNLPLDSPELLAKYGDRVVSRLTEMCNFVVLKGEDRRKLR